MFFGQGLFAQDPQFTQFATSQVYLNPAFAGNTGEHRASLQYRSQWLGIKKAYNSGLASYDYNATQYNAGAGLYVYQDMAGSTNLNTTYAAANMAYRVKVGFKQYVRAGLMVGFGNKSINNGKLVFNDQFITGGTSSPDAGILNSKSYLDLGTGIAYTSQNVWAGMAIKHLNKPNVSFNGGKDILPMLINLHGGYRIVLKKSDTSDTWVESSVNILAQYRHEASMDQMDLGAMYQIKTLSFGLMYRGVPFKKNAANTMGHESLAFLSSIHLPGQHLKIGYSFDFTINGMGFSNTFGAHELSVCFEPPAKAKKRKIEVTKKRSKGSVRKKF